MMFSQNDDNNNNNKKIIIFVNYIVVEMRFSEEKNNWFFKVKNGKNILMWSMVYRQSENEIQITIAIGKYSFADGKIE